MGMYEFDPIDAEDFARKFADGGYRKHGHEISFKKCPYCQSTKDKYTFAISLKSGAFNCKRGKCAVTGNMLTLAKDFGFELRDNESNKYYGITRTQKKIVFPKREEKTVTEKSIDFLDSRGISKEVAQKYEISTRKDNDSILCFPFYDEKGEQIKFIKYRNMDYSKESEGSKEWCEKNMQPILFGMQFVDGTDVCYITEGQLDSLSLATAGIKNAYSVPTGKMGETWVAPCYDFLDQFEKIVAFGDYENGQLTVVDMLRRRFKKKLYFVPEAAYGGMKDANEILNEYGPEYLVQAVEMAEQEPVENVLQLSLISKPDEASIKRISTGFEQLDLKLNGGLQFGQIHVISGKRGEGKSVLGSMLTMRALQQNRNIFIYSGELPMYRVKEWLDRQIAGPNNLQSRKVRFDDTNTIINSWEMTTECQDGINEWCAGRAFVYDDSAILQDDLISIIDTIKHCIEQYDVEFILLDNLMTAIDFVEGERDKFARQESFMKELQKIVKAYDVCIVLVAHLNKSNLGDDNDRVSGVAEITNLAGTVISYGKPDKNSLFDPESRCLKLTKNRATGKCDFNGEEIRYDPASMRLYSAADIDKSEFEFEIPFNGNSQTQPIDEGFTQCELDVLPF